MLGVVIFFIMGLLIGGLGSAMFFGALWDAIDNRTFDEEHFAGLLIGGLLILAATVCIVGSVAGYNGYQQEEYKKHRVEQEAKI